ncbi:MAG TPA: DUF4344 domain-containing metallopeptidase [Candidatus Saccharimonadia bacterium]|nr:DUF4344 domain-containing metallopeptidase [Candidatus Saccharimonadia bacterium]
MIVHALLVAALAGGTVEATREVGRIGKVEVGANAERRAPVARDARKPARDETGFTVLDPELEGTEYAELAAEFRTARVLEDMAATLNEAIELPVELGLRFAECGEPNAYYDPESRVVSVCFELLTHYYEVLAGEFEQESELDDAVIGAFMFVFFHEIGHALVDVLELPVTGREEDAVDQLSAWLLIDNGDGDEAVIHGALSFEVSARASDEVSEDQFADEHSLDEQRVYNMLCWLYGSDPKKYAPLVDDPLPAARADRCEAEYKLLDRSWSRLLEDHVRS